MRYLTGFTLAEGEEKSAGDSGKFLVGGEEVVVLADSRYTIQARREASGARLFEAYNDLPSRWPDLVASVGAKRIGVEAGFVPHATWERLAAAAPGVELVPIQGWIEADRATKEPTEIERIAAACAVADRALAALLPQVRAGATERDLALRLEWLIRTGGAEALAFPVACLSGPEAALPHGSPGERPVLDGAVLLFDFGAQVAGYRSDMTRTLFVGEPAGRDLEIHALVARAQAAAIAAIEVAVARMGPDQALPSGRTIDGIARDVIADCGPGAAVRARDGPRDRARHARGPFARAARPRGAAAQPDRLLGRARGLSRGQDGRPHRGSRPARRCGRSGGTADPLPA